jgi:RNA polymerase sigma-70 factor (ECF subfamily)
MSEDFEKELIDCLPQLRAFALALARNREQAEDLVQDAVARALANEQSFTPGTNFRAWIFTILRNHFRSILRRRQIQDNHAREMAHVPQITPASQEASVWVSDLEAALSRLPDEQREVLILTTVFGLNYEQAAGVCGCAVGTVKSRVSRAREELRSSLSKSPKGQDEITSEDVTKAIV